MREPDCGVCSLPPGLCLGARRLEELGVPPPTAVALASAEGLLSRGVPCSQLQTCQLRPATLMWIPFLPEKLTGLKSIQLCLWPLAL